MSNKIKKYLFLDQNNKYKNEIKPEEPINVENKLGPDDFAATITNILNEKLTIKMNIPSKQPTKHMFDHINTNLIMKQKDQILKSYREPISKIMSFEREELVNFNIK